MAHEGGESSLYTVDHEGGESSSYTVDHEAEESLFIITHEAGVSSYSYEAGEFTAHEAGESSL
jgi:hypothetical protein